MRHLACTALLASIAVGQAGNRVSPIVDVAAFLRNHPALAGAQYAHFACRDANQNWWMVTGDNLVRLDPAFNVTGILTGVSGVPVYEPTTDRVYLAFSTWYVVGSVGGFWPILQLTFGLRYLDLGSGTSLVTQLPSYTTPIPQPPPTQTPPSRTPLHCSANGSGDVLVSTEVGVFSFNAQSGSVSQAAGPLPVGPFMVVPGTTKVLIARAGSCLSGPASTCISEYDLAASAFTGRRFPVDLSLPGPGASFGGTCAGIFPLLDAGSWRALMLQDAGSSYAYALDVTSASEWPGCSGRFTFGPVVEQTAIVANIEAPASLAWLLVSFGLGTNSIPQLPAGCAVHLDFQTHVALGPVLMNGQGQGGLTLQLPVVHGLDNSLLYFQWGHASLAGLGTTEARSAVVRQR